MDILSNSGIEMLQNITMSRCLSNVFTVYGLVGVVEEGKRELFTEIFMISGAWLLPVHSV